MKGKKYEERYGLKHGKLQKREKVIREEKHEKSKSMKRIWYNGAKKQKTFALQRQHVILTTLSIKSVNVALFWLLWWITISTIRFISGIQKSWQVQAWGLCTSSLWCGNQKFRSFCFCFWLTAVCHVVKTRQTVVNYGLRQTNQLYIMS